MGYRLGIDTGGTFTDFVLVAENGSWELFKTPSTPEDPSRSIEAGLRSIAESRGVDIQTILSECELIIYGTTVALNSLIQHNGARVGLFCTRGHEDSLEIRLAHKEDGHRYDFNFPPAQMLVPRRLRVPVGERILADGSVLAPLEENDVLAGLDKFEKEDVESVAICFMWSFLNPAHERRVGEMVAEKLPGVHLTLSVDLLPQIREYTRVSTTALNAYVGPVLERSITEIEALLRRSGYRNPIRYMQCNGGVSSGDFIKRKAVYAINSGPAAGPTAGLHYGREIGQRDLLTLDMGGTSTDISIVQNGQVDIVKNLEVERYILGIPLVNVVNIGAGGGSIAGLDFQGILRVGPQSAEAVPGPACYGRGGEEATVTDALVALGYINPSHLLGGAFPIDSEASRLAILQKVAQPLGLTLEKAAQGIFEVVNSNMIGGIRAVSVERGYDPRDFVFVAGGGATSAHVGRLAEDLGVTRVIIPKVASGLCAFGAAIADVKHSYMATYITPLTRLDLSRLNQLFRDLEQKGSQALGEEGFSADETQVTRTVEMRYVDQVHECAVPIPNGEITAQGVEEIKQLFHQRHEELYTYCERDNQPELVNLEVSVAGVRSSQGAPSTQESSKRELEVGTRRAYFDGEDGFTEVPVYAGGSIGSGDTISGPAIIEEPTTTIVVFPGWAIELQAAGYYWMTR